MNAANRTIGSGVERWPRLLNGRKKKKESDIREEPFILKVFSYVHECGHMYGKENFIIFILTRLFSGFIGVMRARCLRHLKNR